jgi:hypothetical protein
LPETTGDCCERIGGNLGSDGSFATNLRENAEPPSVLTAFEEQLDLITGRANEPFEVFVVDSVEMPTPDRRL